MSTLFVGGRPLQNTHVVYGLIGVNVGVFFAWHTMNKRTMLRHFTLSQGNLRHGRFHTLLTSAFSHYSVGHLAFNMVTLYFFAANCMQVVGQKRFLGLYLAGGLASSLLYLAYQAWLPRARIPASLTQSMHNFALGASGAVSAITMFTVCVYPRATFMLWLVVPVPAFVFGLAFVGWDLWGAYTGTSNTAHAAHLGGAALGVAYWLSIRKRLFLRRF